MDEPNEPSSPSKGKGAENGTKNWRTGWWDFYPLLEQPERPVQWSKSSVIFTAHPTQPVVTGRHFSSSKQFILPSPPPLIASPTSYDPPSVISVGPDELWLFAYFPRRDGEGIGCLWKRGPQIDNWGVKECWTYSKGGGVVTTSWLDSHREWVGNAAGFFKRLPPRGPSTPVSELMLLCVTQDNCVHVTYIRHFLPGLRTIKRSLEFMGITLENAIPVDFGEDPSYTRQCVHAAIGIGYNESSIVIATHSRRVPPPPLSARPIPPFNSMDLSTGVDLTNSTIPDQITVEWDDWEEEHSIELFELQLRFDGFIMAIITSSIPTIDWRSTSLTHLQFIPALPPPSVPTQPESVQPPPTTRSNPPERGMMFLITSSIDLRDYSKLPSSILNLYAVAPRAVSNLTNGRNIAWAVKKFATRTMENGVVTHLESFVDLQAPNSLLLYACILDNSGSLPAGMPSAKESRFGIIKVLTLPNLNDNVNWEPTTLKAASETLGKDLPLFSSISPNRKFICSLSSSLSRNHMIVYPLPRLLTPDLSSLSSSVSLALAILGRVSTTDVTHSLCPPHVPLSDAAKVIYDTLNIFDKYYKSDIPHMIVWNVMGVATEIYKSRALNTEDEAEAEMLRGRWETAHDICSLITLKLAFEGCKEGAEYDLELVWQIISMCTWLVSFTEKMMKACVLSGHAVVGDNEGSDHESPTLTTPILLHLVHPLVFRIVLDTLRHVKDFRTFLGSLPAGSESSQIAQALLVDAVDCSGVDFAGLTSLLEETLKLRQPLDREDCRKALAACQPTSSMQPLLGQLLRRISQSKNILNKSALFIKPFDLVDGVARLTFGNRRNTSERDIVTKGPLKLGLQDLCLRCGGKTSIQKPVPASPSQPNRKWLVWERVWQSRCICGGLWLSAPTS